MATATTGIAILTALGTGGWMPTPTRETSCWLLEYGGRAMIFDLGSGFRRLSPHHGVRWLEPYREVAIFLSHFHLDHLAGLPYLWAVLGARRVKLYAPAWTITGFAAREVLGRLTSRPLFGRPFERFPLPIEVEELGEGDHDLDGLRVSVRRQLHSDPSVAYRVEDVLAYVTDTGCDPATARFAHGCRWLVHECWLDPDDYRALSDRGDPDAVYHSHVDGVARLAGEAGVDRLVLAHLNPAYPEERLRAMAERARTVFPATVLPEDGRSL
mgnify:CR=1 FL=1